MSNILWRGGVAGGSWDNPLDWSPLRVPTTADAVTFAGTGNGEIVIGAPAVAVAATLLGGTDAVVRVASDLTLGGVLSVAGGSLVLAAGGRLVGGTIEQSGGSIVASGGTADGSVWLAAFGNGLVITPATAAATFSALNHPIAIVGDLLLTSGRYATSFLLDSFGQAGAPALVATDGVSVTLDGVTSLDATDPRALANPALGTPPGLLGVSFAGAGALTNAGTLDVSLPAANAGGLTIATATFRNDGLIALSAAQTPYTTQTFTFSAHGKTQPPPVTLTWTAVQPGGLALSGARFTNAGQIEGAGVAVVCTGGAFMNSGFVTLTGMTAETPVPGLGTETLATVTIPATFDVRAGTVFTNTGTIIADTITFEGNVNLASLGVLTGAVTIDGTLDLAGGTLDATTNPLTTYLLRGTVTNGTLIGPPTQVQLGRVTLDHVVVAGAAADILHDVTSGTVSLDRTTIELTYATAATVTAPLVITASGPSDRIVASATGTLTLGAATTITDVTADSAISLNGPGIVDFEGTATLAGATMTTGTLEGAGTIDLTGGARLSIGALDANSKLTVSFSGGGNALILPLASGSGTLGLVLQGLAPGDLIDFAGISSSGAGGLFGNGGAATQDNRLFVTGASGQLANVAITGVSPSLTFSIAPDASGGSLVTVACFRHGTRIATPGGARAVEALSIGDLVDTPFGPRPVVWLGHRAYPAALVAAQRQLRPVRIRAGVLGCGMPTRDLDLSPLHAVLIDGVLLPAAALVDDAAIVRAPIADTAYAHIELEAADIVLAEGVPCETFVDCDSRAMFANAGSFAALYPDARRVPWTFAAPRVEGGWRLATIRDRLGLTPLGRPGTLRGAIDSVDGGVVQGWAAGGDGAVELEVRVGNTQVGCIVANHYRIDLDHAGFEHPAAGFRARLPDLPAEAMAHLHVRRLSDGATIAQ